MKIRIITLIILMIAMASVIKAQDNKLEKIVTITAFTAKGELNKLKAELNAGLDTGLTVNEIKEMIVHSYAYCGFPRAIMGLQTLMAVLEERKELGITDNWGREASAITDSRDKYERGKNILEKLTGKTVEEQPLAGYTAFSPEIETFLKEHLFADIFERDVLTYSQREIVTISVLISIGRAEPMLRSHMDISLNIGITPDQLERVLSTIERYVSEEDTGVARQILEELT